MKSFIHLGMASTTFLLIQLSASHAEIKNVIFESGVVSINIQYYPSETTGLLKHLGQKYNLYLLNTTSGPHDKMGQFPQVFTHLFKKAYFDHPVRAKNSDLKRYQTVLQENGLNPSETLYVDSTETYLEGGQNVGMHTLWVTQKLSNPSLPKVSSIYEIPNYITHLDLQLELKQKIESRLQAN